MATKAKAKSAGKGGKVATMGRGSKSNKWATVQLPAGFTPISQGEFGQPWDFEAFPTLKGTISGETREVESGKGKDRRTSRVVTVDDGKGGRFDVWESAALTGWFDKLEDGMNVCVIFQGYRDTGKASPMKVFVGAIAEDEAEDKPARKIAKRGRR